MTDEEQLLGRLNRNQIVKIISRLSCCDCENFIIYVRDRSLYSMWIGSVVVRVSDSCSRDHKFDSRPVHCRVVY